MLLSPFWYSNFYPRPPRGGRQKPVSWLPPVGTFLSTPSARRATLGTEFLRILQDDFYPRPPRGGRHQGHRRIPRQSRISIHALREEGDQNAERLKWYEENFYPRPPRGGRLDVSFVGLFEYGISIHALREEGDCFATAAASSAQTFLSTPSARRATAKTEKNISAFVSL